MDENKNSISDSTSETFDSWTLVTENPSAQNNLNSTNIENENKSVEVINNNENLKLPDVNIEELSDGISVISETESIEECHDRYPNNEPLYASDSQPEESDTSLNLKEAIQRLNVQNYSNKQVSTDLTNLLTVKNVVSGIFYIGMLAGILGFIGQLKGLHDGTSLLEISSLKERVDNLELNNNLLRAEIDILQKKLTFLTNQHQTNNQFNKYQKYKNQEERKINEKNNDNLNNDYEKQKIHVNNNKPDITSGCEDNEKYINGVCIIIEENQFLKNEKKDGVPIPKLLDEKNSQNNFNKENKNYNNAKINDQQSENDHTKYKKEINEKYQNYKNYDHNKNFSAAKNVDHSAESNEKNYANDDHSFEKFKRDKKDDYYKKSNNKYDDNKKDRYNSKEHHKYEKSKEYNKLVFDKKKHDNDWHEKLMDSRENFRKQKSKEKDGNWYVERGHSREEFRIFENDDYKRKEKKY